VLNCALLNAADKDTANERRGITVREAAAVVGCVVLDQAVQTYYAPEGSNPNVVTNMAIATAYTLLPDALNHFAGESSSKKITMLIGAAGLVLAPEITIGSYVVAWGLDKIAGKYVGNGAARRVFNYFSARAGGITGQLLSPYIPPLSLPSVLPGADASPVQAKCPTLTGPFSTTCNVTAVDLKPGIVPACNVRTTCFNGEGDRVRSVLVLPADGRTFIGVNNVDGTPTIPDSLIPLTGGSIAPQTHATLCANIPGTYAKSCEIASKPEIHNGLPCCSLTGQCKTAAGETTDIDGVIVAPGAFGTLQGDNIENCDGGFVRAERGQCELPANMHELSKVKKTEGLL
ncbi:MAG: hypothetical protein WCN27_04600, partial [Alphaproteobacteria bacterium]